MQRLKILGIPRIKLREILQERNFATFRADQLYRWLFNRLVFDIEQMTDIAKSDRAKLAETVDISLPEVVETKSSDDGTTKLLLKFSNNALAECALIPMRNYMTLCISSQIGCKFGCKFCLTGKMGFVRNLFAHEITAQYLVARKHFDKKISNIVFMGMGEPLDNFDSAVSAIGVLYDNVGAAFSPNRITVSTVGIIPKIKKLAETIPVSVAFSMSAPNSKIRDELMPINKKYPIEKVLGALKKFPLKRGDQVTIEYVMLGGVNDSVEHAHELAEKLGDPVRFKVNLIPFNPFPHSGFESSDEASMLNFQSVLRSYGYLCYIRQSKGQKIFAACGQLGYFAIKQRGKT